MKMKRKKIEGKRIRRRRGEGKRWEIRKEKKKRGIWGGNFQEMAENQSE